MRLMAQEPSAAETGKREGCLALPSGRCLFCAGACRRGLQTLGEAAERVVDIVKRRRE